MGSGKSTVGPILANVLGWDFVDLDQYIEKKKSLSINQIFKLGGEEVFRLTESQCLKELSFRENAVIALGGGTILSDPNFELISKTGIIIYLKISSKSAFRRLRFKENRPIFNSENLPDRSEDNFLGKIEDLMEKRKSRYENADISIDTDRCPVGRTVEKIISKLKRYEIEKN